MLRWVIGGLAALALLYMEMGFRSQQGSQAEIIKRIDGTLMRIETEQTYQRGILEDIRSNGGGG